MSCREYVKLGEYIPNFAMIDQHGEFLQIRSFRVGCLCSTSSSPVAQCLRCVPPLALAWRICKTLPAKRPKGLHFVSITFDPDFDSPGILNQYADGYGMESENFHLLTMSQSVVDDLLRQFYSDHGRGWHH